MVQHIGRREVLVGAAAAFAGAAGSRVALGATPAADKSTAVAAKLAALETKNGGRLGVSILDLETQARAGHRESERFAMCSTFKFLAAACVLSRVDRGLERLDRRLTFTAADLMPNSPITKAHVADGMTMAELCEAAVTVSDNTAANLMLASYGGPGGWTAYARSIGDQVSRLDRMEPQLNDWKFGDVRDTTSPAAMTDDLRKVVLGDALSAASRDRIAAWLVASKTGGKRLRAGLPAAWKVGDKTGTSATDIANDIAVVWPPGRAPLIVSCYFAGAPLTDEQRNAAIAEVGAIATAFVS